MSELQTSSAVQIDQRPTKDRVITYVAAGIEAIREEMRRDPNIFYMGQGIGPRGGNFAQTKGLWAEFGDARVRDTPIAELAEVGLGVGAALAGSRPIVDIVFFDFMLEAASQLIQQASMIHYVSNGTFKVPVVIKGAMGGVRNTGPHHSHTFYSFFMHIPGLRVVLPSTPFDVKGLLKTALRGNDPVLFIEHKALYNSRGHVPLNDYSITLGEAKIRRQGEDVTVVAVGLMVSRALEAARILEQKGISAEVIDPRTVAPLDKTAILDSVAKTGRIAILDEAYATCGLSAEIAALVCEEALDKLKAPARRICALPAPHAFSPSLDSYLVPSIDDAVEEITSLVLK